MRRREFLKTATILGVSGPLLARAKTGRAQALPMQFSVHDGKVKPIVKQMTLDEKLGQMTQAEIDKLEHEDDIATYFLGSVLSGGDADPSDGNGLDAWTNMIDRAISASLKTRLGIPILYGVDAVHGHSNVIGAVIFPHNIGLGCTRNAKLVEEIGRVTAEEVRATGIQWTFAPCIAVPQDDRWGRTYEGFSEDPNLVTVLGSAAVKGLQNGGLDNPLAILACAKHFVGDGGTTYGSVKRRDGSVGIDQGDTEVDMATLERIHLPGYLSAVIAGVGSIMVSYSSWNGVKMSADKKLMTNVLKDEYGFEGFLISDYYAIGQIDPDYKTAVKTSINAGMDMAMEPAGYKRFIGTLKELVNEGQVPMARIDDAVTRILRIKSAMGLLDRSRNQLADPSLHKSFGSPEHRAVARKAVSQSLVLLKNENKALPLTRNAKRIHLAGKGADDIGIQCGGWTIKWQGEAGPITTGTTILQACRAAAKDAEISHSLDGSGAEGADVAVAIVSELPYAEGVGDRADLLLSKEDVAMVEKMKAAGVPLVVIVISGRPTILGEVLDKADAVVAAWLPGTEGQGITDVLFGDVPFTGKLSHTWPRSMDQEPINVGDSPYHPQFRYGWGLTT